MKSIVAGVIVVLTAVFSALPAEAQTPNDKWVSLGEYIKENYNLNGNRIEPKTHVEAVNKLAFKKTAKTSGEYGSVYLTKPTHWSQDSVNYNLDDITKGMVVVTDNFDIIDEGNKTQSKKIPANAEGWKIVEYNVPLLIKKIEGNFPSSDIAMLKNIYVALDPALDPAPKYVAMRDRKKALKERSIALKKEKEAEEKREFEEKIKSVYKIKYSTPEEMGLTPLRTDKLKDGTVIEHYEKFRIYKKPNGDFARFYQKNDGRDPKTMNPVKGMDVATEPDEEIMGAYRLTQPNGVRLETQGARDEVLSFKNGDSIIVTRVIDSKFVTNNKPFFPISLAQFLKPDNQTIRSLRAKNTDGNNYTIKSVGSPIVPLHGVYNRDYGLVFWDNGTPDKDWVNYVISGDRLVPMFKVTDKFSYFPRPLKEYKDGIAYYENGDHISFTDKYPNGNRISITLRDGTKIQDFPNEGKFRIVYPNKDIYVGNIDYYLDGDFGGLNPILGAVAESEFTGEKFDPYLRRGVLTKANGKEYHYEDNTSELEKEQNVAQSKAEYQKLCQKYGKANVENAATFNYKVGMSIDMVKALKLVLRVGTQTGSGTWYTLFKDISSSGKMTVVDVFVNNSTGKIAIVGRPRR